MTRLESIEREIASLSSSELAELRKWFIEFDADAWEKQIERDAAAGKLDAMTDAALSVVKAGKCSEL